MMRNKLVMLSVTMAGKGKKRQANVRIISHTERMREDGAIIPIKVFERFTTTEKAALSVLKPWVNQSKRRQGGCK